ncbi:MAG: type IX secretion system sortase PorU, partial [Muribaculaceae bacterium]|nr:type IX secretion system sortase PorU [Muribaculaceae bacterium]
IIAAICTIIVSATASAVDAGHYTSSSILSSGRWVKIRVNETGIQQITHEQLLEWGFTEPSAVTVFGFGGVAGVPELLDESVPDDLPQQPVVYTDDRLLFYGESNCRPNLVFFAMKPVSVSVCPDVERNNVADAGYYFITDSQPVKELEKIPYVHPTSSSSTFVNHHWDVSFFEEEETMPVRQGQLYFGRDFSQDEEPQQYSFPLDDLYFENSSTTYSKVILHDIIVATGTNPSPSIILNHPNREEQVDRYISLDSSNDLVKFSSNAAFSDSYLSCSLPRSKTSFDIELSISPKCRLTYAAVDRLVLGYERYNNLGDRPSMLLLDDQLDKGRIIEIADADPEVMVWNVDKPYDVRPYEGIYNYGKRTVIFTNDKAYKISKATDSACRIIAFHPGKTHHAVEYAGEIDSQDIHSYDVPDLVILTADAFTDQAERLAQIHRELLGHDVVVLRQDAIFNEFSSGTPSLWGIRKAIKMFYDRNPQKMKHLLLFGGSFYDNRGFTTTGATYKEKGALLLNYGTPVHKSMASATTGYSTDGYFGMLDDVPPTGEFVTGAKQHINVGRIPVTDNLQAIKAVDKIYEYLTYTPTTDIYQRVLLLTDHGGANQHLNSGEVTGASFLANNPGITLIKGYSALYPLKNGRAVNAGNVIKQALKKGVMYVNYTGHGKMDNIGSSNLYSITDVHDTHYSYYPFAMLATCGAYGFDCLEQSIVQNMVLQSNGGMIAAVGSCRSVYQPRNERLAEAMADIFAKSGKGTVTGDILRLGRNKMLEFEDYDLMINTSCYNLCGDPAIPLFFSDHKITLESVNGEVYDGETLHTLIPVENNVITGYVNDPENPGTPWTSFNGTVMLSIYESPIDRKTVTTGGDSPIIDVTCDEDVMLEANGMVVNGRFTINFTPPMPMRNATYNRATITAVLPDNSEVATTYTTSLVCDANAAPDTPSDGTAPEITQMYIDTPHFVNGDVAAQDFTLYASVTDTESGIYNPTGTVGATCRVIIDGTSTYPVIGTMINNNGDGSYNIVYPFTSLADGHHSLTLFISDNAGNSSSRTVEFIINNTDANPLLSVVEEPARIQATLQLQHSFTDIPAGRLIIEDEQGNTVYTRPDISFPYEWDLTDNNGNLVADGVYRAYAICKGGNLYGHTPKIDIIVVQQP